MCELYVCVSVYHSMWQIEREREKRCNVLMGCFQELKWCHFTVIWWHSYPSLHVLHLTCLYCFDWQERTWCPISSCWYWSASRCSSWSWPWDSGSAGAASGCGTTSALGWGASALQAVWWVWHWGLRQLFYDTCLSCKQHEDLSTVLLKQE